MRSVVLSAVTAIMALPLSTTTPTAAAQGVGANAANAASTVREQPVIVITGVTVVPMDRERTMASQTVVVTNGRITRIGPTASIKTPGGATVVDGRGKYLMPGLAEMHAHVPPPNAPPELTDRVITLYLANGVTLMRGMLGAPSHLVLRDKLARGEVVGPRLVTSGPSFNNNTIRTPQAGIDSVLSQKKAGYDFMKIHPGVPREAFDSVVAAAQRVGMGFSGHVPLDVGYARALSAKYGSIDHIDGLIEALLRDDAPVKAAQGGFFGLALVEHLDTTRLPALVKATRESGVAIVPTAALLDTWVDETPAEVLAARPEMAYWLPNQVNSWTVNKRNLVNDPTYTVAQRRRFVEVRRQMIRALHKGGVPFLLGSDSPQVWNVPGFSIHRELQALVEAGFTPYEALATGTRNVATFFNEANRSGQVAVGHRADLVLLGANPLANVGSAAKVDGVIVNGRWIPGTELQRRLAALKQ